MIKPKSVEHEEITTPVMKYRLGDLEEKITLNHSEVLQRFAYIDGKIDVLTKTMHEQTLNNAIEHTDMKKDVIQNSKDIASISLKLWAILMVIIGGISKLVFDLIQGK